MCKGNYSLRPWVGPASLVGRTLGSRTGDRVSGCEIRPCVFTSRNMSIYLSIQVLGFETLPLYPSPRLAFTPRRWDAAGTRSLR